MTSEGPLLEFPRGALLVRVRKQIQDPLYRNSIFLVLNAAVPAFLGILFLKIITARFPADVVGLTSSVLTIAVMLATLSRFMDYGVLRFLPAAAEVEALTLVKLSFSVAFVLGALLSLVAIALAPWMLRDLAFLRASPLLTLAFFVLTVGTSLSGAFDFILIAQRATDGVFWKNSLATALRFPLPILLPLASGLGAILWAYAASSAVGLVISYALVRRRTSWRHSFATRSDFRSIQGRLHFTTASYIVGILPAVQLGLTSALVLQFFGPTQVAAYYLAAVVMALLYVIPSSIGNILVGEGARAQTELHRIEARAYLLCYLIVVPAACFAAIGSDSITNLFGMHHVAGSSLLLAGLALSSIPASFVALRLARLRLQQQTREFTVVSVVLSAAMVSSTVLVGLLHASLEWVALCAIVIQVAGAAYMYFQPLQWVRSQKGGFDG